MEQFEESFAEINLAIIERDIQLTIQRVFVQLTTEQIDKLMLQSFSKYPIATDVHRVSSLGITWGDLAVARQHSNNGN